MLHVNYISIKLGENLIIKKEAKLFWKRINKEWGKTLIFQKGNTRPCEWHHSTFSLHLLAYCSYVGTFHTGLGKTSINLS